MRPVSYTHLDIVEVGNVLSTISSRYKTLTNSEKLVADVVIQRTPEAVSYTHLGDQRHQRDQKGDG